MSSILDALKKSENQHSLGRDLVFRSVAHDAPPRLTRFGIAALVTALLLMLVIAVVLYSRHAPERAQTAAQSPIVADGNDINAAMPRELNDQRRAAVHPGAPNSPPTVVLASSPAPWLSGLPEVFRSSLPPLDVNIHVYSPVASQRILYLNNRQVQQGERIQAGVLVEEIVQDGVVLRFRGQRFKLPRPS